jgi:hypothetical protein
MTSLYHQAADLDGADVVIPLDADEIIQAPDRSTFRAAIGAIPEEGIAYWNWRNHLPWNLGSLQLSDRFCRYQQSENVKILIRVPPRHRRRRDYILPGSHRFLRPHARPPEIFLPWDSIYLAHFPVRSLEQIIVKALTGWMALRAQGESPGGFHWKAICEGILEGQTFDRDWLIWQAMDYGSRDGSVPPPPEGVAMQALALSHPSSLRLNPPDLALRGTIGDRVDWRVIAQALYRTWEDSLATERGHAPQTCRRPWKDQMLSWLGGRRRGSFPGLLPGR